MLACWVAIAACIPHSCEMLCLLCVCVCVCVCVCAGERWEIIALKKFAV